MDYLNTFINGYSGYANYLWQSIINPHWGNYFYWLIAVSLFFFLLEISAPWRPKQAKFRKDFWMDAFYMFFNFFLFSLIIYNAASDVVVQFFNDIIQSVFGFDLQASNPMNSWPMWAILLVGFFVRDFVQWWTHRLLHKSPALWEFHKVHHSVEEMGFAAHLRYHWMETVVYRTMEYLPLALLGIGLYDFFIIHIFTMTVGHYNHSNISVSGKVTGGIVGGLIGVAIAIGAFDIRLLSEPTVFLQIAVVLGAVLAGAFLLGRFMKYIFNSPEMHIWHHAYDMPKGMETGINFGITLAIWDYIFKTDYLPHSGQNIKLGFPGLSKFPKTFFKQLLYGFGAGRRG